MSTRCQIAVFEGSIKDKLENQDFLAKDWRVLLYRHSDGYPEGVLPDILPFIKEFDRVRGHDTEYLGACLCAYLKYWHCGEAQKQYPHHNLKINGFEISVLSAGISKAIHWDIEFFYAIDKDNLYIFDVTLTKEDTMLFKLLSSHKITEEK